MKAAVLATLLLALPATADERGAAIFLRGEGIAAVLSGSGLTLPVGAVSCGNCHGTDGRGTGLSEGGARAPAITWAALSAATALRPAYDRDTLRLALVEGVAADGRYLSREMPLFHLSDADFLALADYLDRLDADQTRGITPTAIKLAVPPDQPALVEALARFNAKGGAWGRMAEIGAEDTFLDLTDAVARLRARLPGTAKLRLAQLAAGDPEAVVLEAKLAASWPSGRHVFALGETVGAEAEQLLARGDSLTLLSPPPSAMAWAMEHGRNGQAATDLMLAEGVMRLFVLAGRDITGTTMDRAIAAANPADWLHRYDYTSGQRQ